MILISFANQFLMCGLRIRIEAKKIAIIPTPSVFYISEFKTK